MTLRQKLVELYKKANRTEEDPSVLDLSRFALVIVEAAEYCDDAEKEVGRDLLSVLRKYAHVGRKESSVDLTLMLKDLDSKECGDSDASESDCTNIDSGSMCTWQYHTPTRVGSASCSKCQYNRYSTGKYVCCSSPNAKNNRHET